MEYKNYLFDLYGTLIDVRTDEQAAQTWKKWGRWLDKHGIKHPGYIQFRREFFNMDKAYREKALSEGYCTVPEIDIMEVYRELFSGYGNPDLTEAEFAEASYAFRVASRFYYRLFPGVEDFLKKIRAEGSHAYILSNAQATYTLPEIRALHLDTLTDDQLISSDYKIMKPDVLFYQAMIEKHNLDPKETVMIGDSYTNDVEGAIHAGLSAIHLAGENRADIFYVNQLKK